MDKDTVEKIRKDIIQCEKHIHFNAAGDSPMPKAVLQKYQEVLNHEAMVGGYIAANEYREDFEKTRYLAATLINAQPHEIALVDSATTAWMRAFYCVKLKPGDIILTSQTEYAGNYVAMLQHTKRHGASIKCLDIDSNGIVDIPKLEQVIAEISSDNIKAICITHIPTNGGVINPVTEIGKVATKHGILYILDSCQGVGQLAIDVKSINCDFLAATGRKFLRGPRGTGFLFASTKVLQEMIDENSNRLQEPPTLDHYAAPVFKAESGELSYCMSSTARRFEQWESNFAGLVALGVAIEYALQIGMNNIANRIMYLSKTLREKLISSVKGLTIMDMGTGDGDQSGIVTFVIDGFNPLDVKLHLQNKHMIYVHTTSKLSSPIDGVQRVLPENGMVRASVSYFNTVEELEKLVCAICSYLKEAKKDS
eukprot:g6468.t1